MSSIAIGSRVGAIQSTKDGVVRFYGYGTYDGEYEPPPDVMGMTQDEYDEFLADLKEDGIAPQAYVLTSPRITLDDGRTVWGSQCWWMEEDAVRRLLDVSETIIHV